MSGTKKSRLRATILSAMLIVSSFMNPCALSAIESEFHMAGVQASLISDRELDEIRGGYSGFYFSLDFSGSWDHISQTGSSGGQLTYHTDQGDFTVSVNNAPSANGGGTTLPVSAQQSLNNGDKEVRMTAFVGDISQSTGAIQICQVPGSNNVVTTIMNMQFTVINVSDPSKLAQLKTILPGFSGS